MVQGELQVAEVMQTEGARRSQLLGALEGVDLLALVAVATMPTYAPRDAVLSRQVPDDALHVILDGDVMEQSLTTRMDEVFARPVGTGGVVGLSDVLTTTPLPCEVRALRPVTTLRVPGDALRQQLSSPSTARAVVLLLRDALRTAEQDRILLTTGDAMARVSWRITELVHGWGRRSRQGYEVTLPLTQEQLGQWSGTSRESVVACLHELRNDGVLETSRRHITVLDLPGLTEAATVAGAPAIILEPAGV